MTIHSTLLAVAVLLTGTTSVWADEAAAVKLLKQLDGAVIEQDASRLGSPVTIVALEGPKVTDAEMKAVKEFKELRWLVLSDTSVTAAGLKELKGCNQLRFLVLSGAKVTDAELTELKELKELCWLELCETSVTAKGLKELKQCSKLQLLSLPSSQLTDDSLGALVEIGLLHTLPHVTTEEDIRAVLTNVFGLGEERAKTSVVIHQLDLSGTKVTDAGLKALKECKELEVLALPRTRIMGAGIKELKECKKLHTLLLPAELVTDDTLRALAEHGLLHTLVPYPADADVSEFPDGFPKSSFGFGIGKVPEERPSVAKLIAALQVGGKRPKDVTELHSLNLRGTKVTAAGLKELKVCKNLTMLDCDVREGSLQALSEIGLLHIYSKATTQSRGSCKDLTDIFRLDFSLMAVTDDDLKQLKDCPNLQVLNLRRTKVTDKGLKELKACNKLDWLNLSDVVVTDDGLKALQSCKSLRHVYLNSASLTKGALKELNAALPGLTIYLDVKKE